MKHVRLTASCTGCIGILKFSSILLLSFLLTLPLAAQSCTSGAELDPASRVALENVGRQFFQMTARGDTSSMRQNSIASLASNFGAVETAVSDNKSMFSGAQATVRGVYVLDAPGTAPLARAEFFCGVWRTPQFAGFAIPNLPPGKWAVVIEDLSGGKAPGTMSLVLQDAGGWKLAGFYVKSSQIAGHDAQWFLSQARQYKSKGELHNAWFYFNEARELLAPVDFMSNQQLDQIYDEAEAVKPNDVPPGAQLTITAGGKNYTVTQMFAVPLAEGLDLVAKYRSPDISNTAQTFADNMALAKALVARFPEFRGAFAGVVVRAVAPNGSDYGTLLAMKDAK